MADIKAKIMMIAEKSTPVDSYSHFSDSLSVFNSPEYVVFPGFCDVHVHFREPGFSYKETVRTGSAAAARGGYTAVCTMPNLNPVPDSTESLFDIAKKFHTSVGAIAESNRLTEAVFASSSQPLTASGVTKLLIK